jgi:hypothetical protein
MSRRSNRETSARRTRQVTLGDLFCRATHGALFLDGLGRVQSATLSKISVDETVDFIVHRDRMEALAQEWTAETMIIVVTVIANTSGRGAVWQSLPLHGGPEKFRKQANGCGRV